MIGYWSLVHESGQAFGVSFPDIAGCIAASDSLEGVLTDGREALSAHIAWLKAEGDPIPRSRTHAELAADPETAAHADGGTWHLIVPRAVQAPRLRVNIMIEPGLLREADDAAEAEGKTRSGLIESALRDHLEKPVSRADRAKGSKARPRRSA